MSEFITYACKVCGKPGMVEYEPVLGRNFDSWALILCHSRCADFMALKERENRAMNSILSWYQRKLKEDDEAVNAEAKEKTRAALVKRTKVYCKCVCSFYRKPFAWEPTMTDEMIKAPERFKWLLYDFERKQRTIIFVSALLPPPPQYQGGDQIPPAVP